MALIEKLNAIGDAIRAKTGGSEKLTLEQMPTEIAAITTGGPIVFTGSCRYVFHSPFWNTYASSATSEEITNAYGMFYESTLETVPFDVNLRSETYLYTDCAEMFYGSKIKVAPKITGSMGTSKNMFADCNYLKEIPEGEFVNSRANSSSNSESIMGMFINCYSLRELPVSYLSNIYPWSNRSANIYYNGFTSCHSLNKIENLPVYTKPEWDYNAFYLSFDYCHRINKLTFAKQSGAVQVAKWSGQTIDLSKYVGYLESNTYNRVTNYNSGITTNKWVTNATQYQALKNDPDWFTEDIAYSRYNKTSAIETINSLPDTSEYVASKGGTNTIKFKGDSGSATDGGAIKDLTAAQIAVATTKGWTVSLA